MTSILALEMLDVEARHDRLLALARVDLTVREGEFVCVLGPTGCGKSTLLDLAAGLKPAHGGQIRCHGKPLLGLNRHASYMFQHDALLPWRTALDNVSLPLQLRGLDKRHANQQAAQWLRRVGLTDVPDHYPHQLSGGMRKRVALAQALIHNASLLLMDEPFAALDAQTRQAMQQLLLELWGERRKSVLFVTHDLDEAITLADRVLVFNAGPASRCIEDIRIPLPRPRDTLSLRKDPESAALYQRLWHALGHLPPTPTNDRG
ncbi:ABC transporter ATP-binding protein [uncultured Pseudomonas sp.]|uniref:ABC transporter ATP-binding protein n=1 Tax=uncultured Pseudomonas sp. TaxID=114707 RepID=UPI00258946E8|nr:ABC transporter ATP-binding protein [uncultured Pseudomonas sp.]